MLTAARCNLQAADELQVTLPYYSSNHQNCQQGLNTQRRKVMETGCDADKKGKAGGACCTVCLWVIMLLLCLSVQVHGAGWTEAGWKDDDKESLGLVAVWQLLHQGIPLEKSLMRRWKTTLICLTLRQNKERKIARLYSTGSVSVV